MTTRNISARSRVGLRKSLDEMRTTPSRSNTRTTSSPGPSHVTPGRGIEFHPTPNLSRSQHGLRRLSFNLQSRVDTEIQYGSESSSDSEDMPLLDGIIGKSWKMHQVSPLFNVQIHTTRLKQYGKYMRERLSCLAIHRMKRVEYKAYFTWFDGENDNFKSLQVEVKTTIEDQPTKTSYSGFLLSSTPSPHIRKNYLHLPLLLCKGSNKMVLSVHNILHNLFDCIITPLQVPQSELKWLSAMLNSDQDVKRTQKNDIVKFKYQVLADNHTNAVSVFLSSNDLKEIWKAVHTSTSSWVTHNEVKLFHDALYYHLGRTQYVNLHNCKCIMFSLPSLTLTYDGFVKMSSKYSAIQTLTFLQSMSNTFEKSLLTWS